MSMSAYASGTSAIAAPAGASVTVSMNTADVNYSTAINWVYANLQYNSSGTEYKNSAATQNNFTTSRGAWLDTGAAADVWLERTITSGTLFTDPGSGRLNLATTRSFRVRDTNASPAAITCDLEMDMWDAASGGNNLDNVGSIILTANYNNPCPLCCFLPSTAILMGDGTSKPIVEIEIGDVIRTIDGTEEVTEIIPKEQREMWRVELEDGRTLILSEDHPVFIDGKGYSSISSQGPYKDLNGTDQIVVGDSVQLDSGILLKIVKMHRDPFDETVYTLGNSRFYANGILVY
jgi:hypothetical protein